MVHARRKTPEELLREAESHESALKRSYLKIFLGYASGVGKSFRMLDEARRRQERGQDVVVGAIQPQVSPEVERLLSKLTVIRSSTLAEVQRSISTHCSHATRTFASLTVWRMTILQAAEMLPGGKMRKSWYRRESRSSPLSTFNMSPSCRSR
jgi:Osmosensitive K+ channel histidine kinase